MEYKINFDKWVKYNWLDLSHNYNSRDVTDSFHYFCEFIFVGMNNNVWLPAEYTKGIIIKKGINK